MSRASTRPSAALSATVSISSTGFTRAAMMPTASSTDIIGPPKAKQSSDNCAILPLRICRSGSGRVVGQHVCDRYRGALQQGGCRFHIIEMGQRKPGFNHRIGDDADDIGVVGEQQRLVVGNPVHLDLAMRLALET